MNKILNNILLSVILFLIPNQIIGQEYLDKSFGNDGCVIVSLDSIIHGINAIKLDNSGNLYVLGQTRIRQDSRAHGIAFGSKSSDHFLHKFSVNGSRLDSFSSRDLFKIESTLHSSNVRFKDEHVIRRMSDKVQLYDLEMNLLQEYNSYSQDSSRNSDQALQFLDFSSNGNLTIAYGTAISRLKNFTIPDSTFGTNGFIDLKNHLDPKYQYSGLRLLKHEDKIELFGFIQPKKDSAIIIQISNNGHFLDQELIPMSEYNMITIAQIYGYPNEIPKEKISSLSSKFPKSIVESFRKLEDNSYLVKLSNREKYHPIVCHIFPDGSMNESFANKGIIALKELGGYTNQSYPWTIGKNNKVYMVFLDMDPQTEESYVEEDNKKYRLYCLDLNNAIK